MVNGKKRQEEGLLKTAFESGFKNAVTSLSQMVQDKIESNSFHFGFHRFSSSSLPEINRLNRSGKNTLLTTEIFGEASGKSYLFLTQNDVEALTHGMYGSHNRIDNLKEEYLKELDNILSAAVITKLSNELGIKIFGDIPILVNRSSSGSVHAIIEDDFNEQTEEIYINAAFFTFEKKPAVTPFFIWVIDSSTLKCVQANPAML